MLTCLYTQKGPAAEVLQWLERPRPEPQVGEVRVCIAYSGVNPSDVKSRAGVASKLVVYPEVIPHSDGSGTIDAVGPGVPASRLGERVWVYNAQWERPHGTAAEFVTLPASQAVPLPMGVSFEVGASIGIPLMTAFHAVARCGTLLGKQVLVTGGAGAVGAYALQLARQAGARVITSVSNDTKAAQVRALGADAVNNYRSEDLVARVRELSGGQGVDALIDVDAASHAPHYGSLLAQEGQAVVYGSNTPQLTVPFGPAILGFVSIHAFIVYKLRDAALRDTLEGVNRLLVDGRLQHPTTAVFPLSAAVAAHQRVEAGANAKVLLKIQ